MTIALNFTGPVFRSTEHTFCFSNSVPFLYLSLSLLQLGIRRSLRLVAQYFKVGVLRVLCGPIDCFFIKSGGALSALRIAVFLIWLLNPILWSCVLNLNRDPCPIFLSFSTAVVWLWLYLSVLISSAGDYYSLTNQLTDRLTASASLSGNDKSLASSLGQWSRANQRESDRQTRGDRHWTINHVFKYSVSRRSISGRHKFNSRSSPANHHHPQVSNSFPWVCSASRFV